MAILNLHAVMSGLSLEFRWLATSMQHAEVADILRWIQEDQLEFEAQGIRELEDQFVIRPARPGEFERPEAPEAPDAA
jgi:hypothetical protein